MSIRNVRKVQLNDLVLEISIIVDFGLWKVKCYGVGEGCGSNGEEYYLSDSAFSREFDAVVDRDARCDFLIDIGFKEISYK